MVRKLTNVHASVSPVERVQGPGVNPVLDTLHGAVAGAMLLLAASGTLAFAGGAAGAAVAARLHLRAGDAFVGAAILVVVAAYAVGLHRASPRAWIGACLLAAGAGALYVLGGASVADAAGAAGRAHVAEALGVAPPSAVAMRAAHAALGLGVALLALLPVARAALDAPARRRFLLGGALAGLALVALAAWTLPAPLRIPSATGGVAVPPPWPALALVPIETTFGLRAALACALAAFTMLLLMPVVDRPERAPWVRRGASVLLTLGLVSLLTLLAYGSVLPSGTHAHSMGAP